MTAEQSVCERHPDAICVPYWGQKKVFRNDGRWIALSSPRDTEEEAWADAWAAIQKREQARDPDRNILRENVESEIKFLRHSLSATELWLKTIDRFCESPHPAVALVSSPLSGEQQAVVIFLARMKLAEIAVEAAREAEKRG